MGFWKLLFRSSRPLEEEAKIRNIEELSEDQKTRDALTSLNAKIENVLIAYQKAQNLKSPQQKRSGLVQVERRLEVLIRNLKSLEHSISRKREYANYIVHLEKILNEVDAERSRLEKSNYSRAA